MKKDEENMDFNKGEQKTKNSSKVLTNAVLFCYAKRFYESTSRNHDRD
jgi:hypothetical protein